MIRAVIIDDEDDARFMLKNLLERHFNTNVQLVGEAEDINEGQALIERTAPDLVFLDIKINDQTGFDLLERIEQPNFEVVFVTAYDEFALRAFEFSAIGYLMKPIRISALEEAIRSVERKTKPEPAAANDRIKILIEHYGDRGEVRKLVIPHLDGFNIVDLSDIIRLEGDRNYTHFIFRERKRICATKSLGEYEKLLTEYGFYRIHQSTMLNLRHVTAFHRADNTVESIDGVRSALSRQRKAGFMDRFL